MFHKSILTAVPAECLPVVPPVLAVLTLITEQIKILERDLVARSKRDYPVTQRLQQIAGVGPLTALCFVFETGSPRALAAAGMWGRIWACARAATRAGARTSNCASANVAMACCADSW